MARKGSLSAKTFFPNTDDQLVNEAEGILWTCVRSNTYVKPSEEGSDASSENGTISVRYALLEGVSGDERLWLSINDQGEKLWLTDIVTIFRAYKEGSRKYDYSDKTKTWQEAE